MNIQLSTHDNLVEGVEELVYETCRDAMVSGECVYTVLQSLAEAKLAQLRGEVS